MNLQWFVLAILLTSLRQSATSHKHNSKKCKNKTDSKPVEECPKDTPKYEDMSQGVDCFPFSDLETFDEESEIPLQSVKSTSRCACIDCAMCMAIVEKLCQKLLSNQTKPMFPWQETESSDITPGSLEDTCVTGFQRYEFQECEEEQYFGPIKPSSKHIPSDTSETWAEKLADMCYMLVTSYGERNIYYDWKEDQSSLQIGLCRGNGVFGACNYMNENITKPTEEEEEDDDDDDDEENADYEGDEEEKYYY